MSTTVDLLWQSLKCVTIQRHIRAVLVFLFQPLALLCMVYIVAYD